MSSGSALTDASGWSTMAAGEGDLGVEREARIMRYKEKTKYASRKACAEMQPRIKGPLAKAPETSRPSPELPHLPDNTL
ncbi:hypothetical protein B296_00055584 [Ensete ventricosum]|uniref:CCT domain-containing protein n=1 Tax=Ensete ventricosum TaxID=4639 RepID=A0A426XZ13_ENSVE|nr:hypothetical protein B296_00055584 [Ensete ventricosum]